MNTKINGGVLYFVLKGLMNGVSGEGAYPPGGGIPGDDPYPDGWYWLPDDSGDEPLGPYDSKEEAILDTKPVEMLGLTFTRMSEFDMNHIEVLEDLSTNRAYHASSGKAGVDLYWVPTLAKLIEVTWKDNDARVWVLT